MNKILNGIGEKFREITLKTMEISCYAENAKTYYQIPVPAIYMPDEIW